MNNNDSGTRSFEPVQPKQQPTKPTKKAKPTPKKVVAAAIFTVVIAIIVLFCAIIIAEIAYKVSGDPTDNVNGTPKYNDITVSSADSAKGELIIVNKQNPMSDSLKSEVEQTIKNVFAYNAALKTEDPSHVVYYKYRDTDDQKSSLVPTVADKFNAMTTALYNETGCGDILFAYGYMKPNDKTLDCDYIHQAGMTADIKLSTGDGTHKLSSNSTVYTWLNTNCSKFGFINSYPVSTDDGYSISGGITGGDHGSDEVVASAQYRYVGIAHATYIMTNSLTVEGYISLLKTSHNGNENALNITGADGNSYSVYYVAASGSETAISVPSNYNYTISGDNMGGFIVTVNLSEKID